jgi:lipid II:glycine glycyltransferase (peptidoglycan interpeptide bridge formation enzyme)
MGLEIHIDDFSREQWENCAKHFADYNIYQTWPYQQVRVEMDGQNVSRVIVTDEGGNPATMCQVRIKNVRFLGLKIGYVQWGPLLRRNDNTDCPVEALRMLRDAYVGAKVNILRLVPNIWDDDAGKLTGQTIVKSGFQHVSHYEPYHTLRLGIDTSEEQIRSKWHRNFSSSIKKAQKSALELRQGTEDEFCGVLEKLYLASIKRKGFRGLDIDEFLKIQELLSLSEKMRFLVAYKDQEPLSVLLASELGDTGIVLLAATSEKGLSCGSSQFVWYHAALAAKEAGVRILDLGGIDPVKNPTVYKFKLSMGSEEVFHIGAFEAAANPIVKNVWRIAERVYKYIGR